MVFRTGITPELKAVAFMLRRDGYSYQEVANICHIGKSSAIRFASTVLKPKACAKGKSTGRPRKLNIRERRGLFRSLTKLQKIDPNFTVNQLVSFSGLNFQQASYRTYVRYLHEEGYASRQTRKKGLLDEDDKLERRKFARKCKDILEDKPQFFSEDIKFYLDGVSFVHKRNPYGEAMRPKARVWRKRNEGLKVTAKGSKDLAGGKRLHLMVAIAKSKGVLLAEEYEKMNGDYFSGFIHRNFESLFLKCKRRPNTRLFVMDNDPCQTSHLATEAMNDVGGELFKIPARSPDINPIENIFHIVKRKLAKDAIDRNILRESFVQFTERVKQALNSIDTKVIDDTIDSMPKRILAIIDMKGHRTKY